MSEKKVRAVRQYSLRAGLAVRDGGESAIMIEMQLTGVSPIPRFKGDLRKTEWLALSLDHAEDLAKDLMTLVNRHRATSAPPDGSVH